jgi:hypothetical protein
MNSEGVLEKPSKDKVAINYSFVGKRSGIVLDMK